MTPKGTHPRRELKIGWFAVPCVRGGIADLQSLVHVLLHCRGCASPRLFRRDRVLSSGCCQPRIVKCNSLGVAAWLCTGIWHLGISRESSDMSHDQYSRTTVARSATRQGLNCPLIATCCVVGYLPTYLPLALIKFHQISPLVRVPLNVLKICLSIVQVQKEII